MIARRGTGRLPAIRTIFCSAVVACGAVAACGAVVACVACATLTGCGGREGNRVQGTVTFEGRPVPAGKVYIRPDPAAGGGGATGFADIVDGRFDTARAGGRNSGSGPMIVAVEGIDPGGGAAAAASPDVTARLLFQGYELPLDVPAGGFTLDIAVPAAAAGTLPRSASP